MMQSMLSKQNKDDMGNAVVMNYLSFEYTNFGLAAYTDFDENTFATNSRRMGKQFRSRQVNQKIRGNNGKRNRTRIVYKEKVDNPFLMQLGNRHTKRHITLKRYYRSGEMITSNNYLLNSQVNLNHFKYSR